MNHKIIQWIYRGIKANKSELLLLMTQQQPTIVWLQETFLKTNDDITIKNTKVTISSTIPVIGLQVVSQSLLETTYLKAKSTIKLNSKQ